MSPVRPHTTSDTELISPARLEWPDQRPYSPDFEDIYYSADAEGEVRRVFLDPVNFSDRARARELTVAETGFGTGLNLAVAAEQVLAAGGRMHFLSCEAAPLTGLDAARVFRHRSDTPLCQELLAGWPPLLKGWHRRVLAAGRVRLSLFHGDVGDFLSELEAQFSAAHSGIDHWLLDGFAPDRNPELWSDTVLTRVAALTAKEGTVATFTARGQVRRGLEAGGFDMRRVDQRPHKRESLAGTQQTGKTGGRGPSNVHVIGAGMAGAWAARCLAERGFSVQISDQGNNPGAGASGIPAAAQHGRLLADGSPAARLRAAASTFAFARCRDQAGVRQIGALQGPGPTADEPRLARIAERYRQSGDWLGYLDADAASEIAGVDQNSARLWFEGAGVVDGPTLLADLLDHPGIDVRWGEVGAIDPSKPTVLATGPAVTAFDPAAFIEVLPITGQLDVFHTDQPRCVLLGNGYLAPLADAGQVAVGSTYEHAPWPQSEATEANTTRLTGFGLTARNGTIHRFRAARAVSSDRTPVVGRITDDRHAHMWVCTGLGSLGATFAPLAGEVIASEILGEPAPLSLDLLAALAPERFKARQARRGLKHGARAPAS